MIKLFAVVNITTKGSVNRRSYNTFPRITCRAPRTTGGITPTMIASCPARTNRGAPSYKGATCVSRGGREVVRIRITTCAIIYPSLFFKINSNRNVF